MKKITKTSLEHLEYIEELESKIVNLTLKLKAEKSELKRESDKNDERTRKLIHDLKNPVGVIYSFSEMIEENSSTITPEKLNKYIDVIKNSAKFSLDALSKFAVLNRLNAYGSSLKLATLNYNEIVNNVLKLFEVEAAKKNIIITKKLPENPVFFTFDKEEVEKVLKNLMSNALRFSRKNTTINIEIIENENDIETNISDQGCGISQTDLPKVFDEFYIVNTYCNDARNCIGLGLAITKLIVEMHQGKIAVTSTLGKGSSFKFTILKDLK